MESYDFKIEDIINARERFNVPKRLEPPIDELISRIVGQKVYSTDPRLLKFIVSWKKKNGNDERISDNFIQNPKFISELKQIFNTPL